MKTAILNFGGEDDIKKFSFDVTNVVVRPNNIGVSLKISQEIKHKDYKKFSPKSETVNISLGGVVENVPKDKIEEIEAENKAIEVFMEAMQKMPEFTALMQLTQSKASIFIQ